MSQAEEITLHKYKQGVQSY